MIFKIVFLLIILIIALYFMFPTTGSSKIENFVTLDESNSTYTALIVNIYNQEIHRDPSQKEINFFIDFIKNQNVSNDDLMKVIKDSADVVAATFQSTPDDDVIGIYGTEEDVIAAFNDVLNRNPDAKELPMYSKKIAKEADFTTEKLKLLLYSTDEYQRMEKTQDNKTFSTLPGGVTDRQLTLVLMKLFTEVTGLADVGDKDTLSFLKKKFVQFDLDSEKMKIFLLKYYLDQDPTLQTRIEEEIIEEIKEKDAEIEAAKKKAAEAAAAAQHLADTMSANIPKKHELDKCYTIDGIEYCSVQAPNKKIIEDMLRNTKADSDNYLDSSDVLDLIKKQPDCVYDQKKMALKTDESAAEAYLERCLDNMNSTCVRNKEYMGADEDLVLLPDQRWSVPQRHPPVCVGGDTTYKPQTDQTALIGTLLDDANHTKIGNVLPLHPPGRP